MADSRIVLALRDAILRANNSNNSYVDPNIGRVVKIGTSDTTLDGDDATVVRCLTAAKVDYVVSNVGEHFTHHSRKLKHVMMLKAKEFTERQNAIVSAITSNMDDCVNYARQTEIALGESNMQEAMHSFRMIQLCERRDAQLRNELERLRAYSNSGDLHRLCSMNEVRAAVTAFNDQVNTMFNAADDESDSGESDDQSEETEKQTLEGLQNVVLSDSNPSSDAAANSSQAQMQPATSSGESNDDGLAPVGLGSIVSAVESDLRVTNIKSNVLSSVSLIGDRVARLQREQILKAERENYRIELEGNLRVRFDKQTNTTTSGGKDYFQVEADVIEEAFMNCELAYCMKSILSSIVSPVGNLSNTPSEILFCRLYLQVLSLSQFLKRRMALIELSDSDNEASVSKPQTEQYVPPENFTFLLLHPASNAYYELVCDREYKSLRVADSSMPQLTCIGRPLVIQQYKYELDQIVSKDDCVVISVEEVINEDLSKAILVRRMKRVEKVVHSQAFSQQNSACSSQASQNESASRVVKYMQISAHPLAGVLQHFERMRYFQVDEFSALLCALNKRTPSALIYNYDFVTGSLVATHVLKAGIVDMTYENGSGLIVACCTDRVVRFLSCTGLLLKEVDSNWLMNLHPFRFRQPYHLPLSPAYAPVQLACTDDLIYILYELTPQRAEADLSVNTAHHWRLLLFRGDTSFSCELVIADNELTKNCRIEKLVTIQRTRIAFFTEDSSKLHVIRLVSSPAELIHFHLFDCFEIDHCEMNA